MAAQLSLSYMQAANPAQVPNIVHAVLDAQPKSAIYALAAGFVLQVTHNGSNLR
jgi:hypothetical protein